jgi:hypothetical protein
MGFFVSEIIVIFCFSFSFNSPYFVSLLSSLRENGRLSCRLPCQELYNFSVVDPDMVGSVIFRICQILNNFFYPIFPS